MVSNPYKGPTAQGSDREVTDRIDVTWASAMKVWWSLAWRGLLFGSLVGFVAGAIIGVIGAVLGTQREIHFLLGTMAGVLAAVPVGIRVVHGVLRKFWSDFQITLVAKG